VKKEESEADSTWMELGNASDGRRVRGREPRADGYGGRAEEDAGIDGDSLPIQQALMC
jgi:hypothetical protein